MDRPRVVITGVGVIASNGMGKKAFASALMRGLSGIGPIKTFDPSGYSSQIAGAVLHFQPEEFIEKRELRRMERFVQFALASAKMAIHDSGLDLDQENIEEMGIILGTGMGSMDRTEKEYRTLFTQGPSRISPTYLAAAIPNTAAAQIAIALGLGGYLGTTLASCAAGTQAVGEAYHLLQRGWGEVILAGGTEANISPLYLGAFCNMKALSTRNEDPVSACRPFDRDRDGFVLAEGAGILVLETLEHAMKRGAHIYGEIAGFGVSSDGHHLTAPDPEAKGMIRAMKRALSDGKMNPEEVDYINAHGTGTFLNDWLESYAIKRVFGWKAYDLAVSATKSMTGHSLSAAGAIELIATLLAMQEHFIPPTINYKTPDPQCELDYVPNEARQKQIVAALSNSFGFGGQNASILVRRM